MTTKNGIKKVGVYEYEPICTRNYDGLECDGPCAVCDEAAKNSAEDAAEVRFWEERR
jgi:hypothetical protein